MTSGSRRLNWPDAILVKNQVGNLNAILFDDSGRRDVAWCDLRFGGVEAFYEGDDEGADV